MTHAITQLIAKARPSLSSSSCSTYSSIIRSTAKKAGVEVNSPADVEKHFEALWKQIMSIENIRSRKTVLSSFVVLVDGKIPQHYIDRLRTAMMNDVKVAEDEEKSLQMTDKQKTNWMPYEEVMKKISTLGKEVKPLWRLGGLNDKQLARLQLYVVLMMLIGADIPPRRSLDLIELRWADDGTGNFIDLKNKTVTYRLYKTAKVFGVQKLPLNDVMVKVFKDWKKVAPNKTYVFADSKGEKLTGPKLNSILTTFFNPKKISTSLLRHIYVTHKLQNIPKDVADVAKQMGHSVEQNLLYRKVDSDDDE